ncbi:PepSY domain-containing protein [Chitinophaga alhagiae]|uniref:PepSY domain-containing protein n=1 Tax=Chitinophaga alhagiae TaxID=2203219 RepID=A0ABM6W9N3_9BACT|nr:PepSY-associated TM helix domain-containing protein [Chitinophaga alhagiae]AWO00658.1 PepSY domain-containing protein [Chitinophaga alhagiae]
MTAKKIIRQLHLWLGLVSGLVVLVVTLSGAVLVFEKELEPLTSPSLYYVQPGAQRLPIDSLKKQAERFNPAMKLVRVEMEPHAANRTMLFFGKEGTVTWMLAVNPYTGAVVRAADFEKRFFRILLNLHRYLLANELGKAVTGVCCLIFLVLVISGIVLWWPRRWKYFRQRIAIKWNGSFKRVVWDLHAVGGFYVHLVIFVIAFTGLTWSYKWFNNGIFLLFDGKPMVAYKAPANKVMQPGGAGFYERVYQQANQELAYKGSMVIQFPPSDSIAVTVTKESYEARITNVVDFIYYEQGTGNLLQKRLYKDQSTGMKVRRAVYPVHTGEIFGWPTKLLALLACLVAASLPVTGLLIWLKGARGSEPKQKVKCKKIVLHTLAEVNAARIK